MNKIVTALLVAVMAVIGADRSCTRYDVPAGSDRGDSAGDNQPAQACQLGEVQMVPVAAPEVYNYALFVEIEDEDCGTMNFKDKMSVERTGLHGRPHRLMVFDDGKSGIVNVPSPYRTGTVTERSTPHEIGLVASVPVTTRMIELGASWLTCRIERNQQLVTGLGQVGLARVALTSTGIHTVHCRVQT